MMRMLAPAALILFVAACGGAERNEDRSDSGKDTAAVDRGPTEPVPADGAAGDDGDDAGDGGGDDDRTGGGTTPGSDDPDDPVPKDPGKGTFFDWTGRFAASRDLCRGGAWTFARDRISTAGETSCRVDETRDAGNEATLFLSCTAEGMKSKETWTLTRDGDGMRVRRDMPGEVVNVRLIRCP